LLAINRAVREADQASPSVADVRNDRNYTFTPPICLLGVYRKDFTFIIQRSFLSPRVIY
jgi:hypothetical protein